MQLLLKPFKKNNAKQGVNAGRNNIILSLAEKLEIFMSGIYDSRIY
jgi:hypothetical protein